MSEIFNKYCVCAMTTELLFLVTLFTPEMDVCYFFKYLLLMVINIMFLVVYYN